MSPSESRRRRLANAARKRKARPRPGRLGPTPPASLGPLAEVAFGSTQARRDAEEAGLSWRDFADSDVVPSGTEGYLVEDVKEVREQAAKPVPEER